MAPASSTASTATPLDTVRAMYDAFARRDVPGVMSLLDADVVIRQSDELPWGGSYRGPEEAMRFFGLLTQHIDTSVEVERMVCAGDCVVEVGRTVGRGVATGRAFAIDEVHVWRVRDGRIVAMEAFVDNARMQAAIA